MCTWYDIIQSTLYYYFTVMTKKIWFWLPHSDFQIGWLWLGGKERCPTVKEFVWSIPPFYLTLEEVYANWVHYWYCRFGAKVLGHACATGKGMATYEGWKNMFFKRLKKRCLTRTTLSTVQNLTPQEQFLSIRNWPQLVSSARPRTPNTFQVHLSLYCTMHQSSYLIFYNV